MARKLILSIGISRDAGSFDADEDLLKRAASESRWRPGIATIGDRRIRSERSKVIDGYHYRIGDQILGSPPDAFLPTEFMDWRDG